MTNNKTDKPAEQPTHAALPLPVYLAVMKTIGTLPWEQANPLMAELQRCQQITLQPDPATNNDQSRLSTARG
jgi:hypothetical protein